MQNVQICAYRNTDDDDDTKFIYGLSHWAQRQNCAALIMVTHDLDNGLVSVS